MSMSTIPNSGAQKGTLTQELDLILSRVSSQDITVSDLLQDLSYRSHGLVALLLSLPFLLPLPMMGLSTIFGAVIAAAGLSIAFRKNPWLPARLKNRSIPKQSLVNFVEKCEGYTKKLERWVKPRFLVFAKGPLFLRLHGLMIFIAALILALPSPPGGNAPPAAAIAALSLGLVEEDGLVVALGWFLTIACMVLLALILIFGLEWLMNFYQQYV